MSQARTVRQSPGDDGTVGQSPGGDRSTRTRRMRRPARDTGAPAPLVLDRYRLHRRLGSGGFGTVWMARDERLERDVAVKILPRERIVGGRFEREARATARLAHPGIVTLYEAAVDDDGAYLVSELVRGSTLDRLLEAGRLSDQDIVSIGIALCDALEHAHAEGVVHRDVKPSNILVPDRPASPAQLAKLTDFGVARVIGGDSLTLTGDVIGTLAYMAPEQAEGREAGAGADLYSLALVLYEALTGVNPVRQSTAAQRARRLGAHLPPLRRQRRDLPRELGQGIDLALRPRPRERGTVIHLHRALMAAREQVGDAPGVVADPWSSREPGSFNGDGRPFTHESLPVNSAGPPAFDAEPAEAPDPAPVQAQAWPARGLGALAAAATAAWLSVHILAGAALPPAAAALVAGTLTLVLPRLGWLALTGGMCALAIAQGHSGYGLLVLVALLLPVLPMIGRPTAWPLAAGAPALGLIGLAGAWPALAARAPTFWRRAALGAAGWIWLLLAAPIAGRVLYLSGAPGTSDAAGRASGAGAGTSLAAHGATTAAVWSDSPYGVIHHVLGPLISSGAFVPAVVWALAAVLLPWAVRGRSPALDLVRVVIWSATVVLATTATIIAVHGSNAVGTAPSAVLGAVAAAVLALAAAWLGRGRRQLVLAEYSDRFGGQLP